MKRLRPLRRAKPRSNCEWGWGPTSADKSRPRSTRWHYLDPLLLWLYPASYLAHIAEETWAGGGFPRWAAHVTGHELSVERFLVANLVGLGFMIAGMSLATFSAEFGFVAIAVATVALLNTLSHLAGTIVTEHYSPGLITGVVLWVPLAQLTLMRAWYQASTRTFVGGLIVGAAIEAIISIVVTSRMLG